MAPLDLQALHANYQPLDINRINAQYAPRPTAPKSSGRKGFIKYLPAAAAAGAGIAAAPFTGGTSLALTLAALGTAGLAGGFGGELAAQKLSHENTDVGKAVKQGVIGGALSAIPLGGVARTAKISSQVAKDALEESAPKLVPQAAKGLRGNLALHGQQMEARSGGYAVNAKIPGAANLDLAGSKQVGQVLNREGIKAASPINRLGAVEVKLKNYGQQIDNIVSKSNVAVSKAQRQKIADQYLKDMQSNLSTPSVMKAAKSYADEFVKNGGKNASSLIKQKRALDENVINYIRNPDAAIAHEQQAALGFRKALKDATDKVIPGVKTANGKYHDLANAKAFLVKGAGEMNSRGGLVTRIAESGPLKTIEAKAGRAMQTVAGNPTSAAAPGIKRTAGTELAKQSAGVYASNPAQSNPADLASAINATNIPDASSFGATGTTAPTETASPYPLEKVLADIQRDPKNSEKYLSVYKAVAAASPAGGAGKPLGSTQQQQVNNANSGLRALQTMKGELLSNPGVLTRSGIPGQTLPLVGGYITNAANAGTFEAARNEASDIISRLRTGAAINKEEERFYKSQLPRAGDSPSTIQYKLNLFEQLFSSFATPQNSGGATADLSNALLQAQGAY